MTAQSDKSKAAKVTRPDTDRKGFVTVKKDSEVAKVVPTAVKVWEERGWSVVKDPETPATTKEN